MESARILVSKAYLAASSAQTFLRIGQYAAALDMVRELRLELRQARLVASTSQRVRIDDLDGRAARLEALVAAGNELAFETSRTLLNRFLELDRQI